MTEQLDLTLLSRTRERCANGEGTFLRRRARLSLRDVATAVGVPLTTLYRWERGDNAPHGNAALRYGQLLDTLADR